MWKKKQKFLDQNYEKLKEEKMKKLQIKAKVRYTYNDLLEILE